jgi:hypothetical protein
MSKFLDFFYESEAKNSQEEEQLVKGTKTEHEHSDLWNIFSEWAKEKDLELPVDEETFYETIAKSHVSEIPDYYDRLAKMENDAKGKKEVDEDTEATDMGGF